jgi:putative membrane protein
MAMGAADLVPGVSGGTVALITGIYDDLLQSISAVSLGLVGTLKNEGIKGVWKALNAPFLIALAAGIGTSIVALSGLLHHLLEHHKAALFAFFFGLVAASIPLVGREITQRSATIAALFITGAAFTFGVGSLPPLQVEPSLVYLFACGAVAACAMILPGISGSFVLLLLGVYSMVIGALKELDLLVIATVGAGAVSGLLGFSKGLKALLARARNQVMATLTGLLLGSLQALWPWKENALLLHTHSDGRETWLQTNAWPDSGAWLTCLACAAAGAGLVIVLERLGNRLKA